MIISNHPSARCVYKLYLIVVYKQGNVDVHYSFMKIKIEPKQEGIRFPHSPPPPPLLNLIGLSDGLSISHNFCSL